MGERGRYRYVGPEELRGLAGVGAVVLDNAAALGELDHAEAFTFVVALDGRLRLGPRRSEHVALAGGCEVLAAGEMSFVRAGAGWRVAGVSNQSTGYCPDPDCWGAVAGALDRLGLPHPGGFTDAIVFRRCPGCGERNIVRDGDFRCALCDGVLPEVWNFT